jgi:crotonobetaine/carnitine-CoA ligase
VSRLDLDDPAERLLGRVLRRQAEAVPDRPFLVTEEATWSYGEVNRAANAWAAGLAGLGVGVGDPVALFMESGPECVFAALGANKLGALWVPTNTDYKGRWLRETFSDGGARVLVADGALLPRVAELGPGLPFEHVVARGAAAAEPEGMRTVAADAFDDPAAPEPDDAGLGYGDTAAVLWTSGTTGRSKGVMQSHNCWIRGAVNGARTAGVRDDEVLYSCLPMYNSAAWVANVFRAMVTGRPCALDARFSAGAFWDRCRRFDATMVFTLGAMHMFLWNAPPRPEDADNPVRTATMIPMPEPLIGPFRERFGLEAIHQGYGQSECMTLFARTDDGRRRWKPNSVGEPQTGIEVALLDDEDRPVPAGQAGELCVRPTEPFVLMNGYFGRPEATLGAFRNLWYHTGDLLRRDEDGDWFFVDRKSDYIRYKGRNLSSFAVEATVNQHPAVAESAAHGVPSRELEHEAELKVCVVLHPGETVEPEALARFVNENAPHFFVPRYVEFMEDLPRTPTGRVQKFKLRERGVTPATWDARAAGFVVDRG